MKNKKKLFYFHTLKKICCHKEGTRIPNDLGNHRCPLVPKALTMNGMCRAKDCPYWAKGESVFDPNETICDACGEPITENQKDVGHDCNLHEDCCPTAESPDLLKG